MLFGKKKKNRRRVFGFLCTPELPIVFKLFSRQLQVPIYTICEHALQLGGTVIQRAIADSKAMQILRDHLIDEHLIRPQLNADNDAERRLLKEAEHLEHEKQKFDSVTKEIIQICEEENVSPSSLLSVLRGFLPEIREALLRKGKMPSKHNSTP